MAQLHLHELLFVASLHNVHMLCSARVMYCEASEEEAGMYARIDTQEIVLTKVLAEQCYCLFCRALLPTSSSKVLSHTKVQVM